MLLKRLPSLQELLGDPAQQQQQQKKYRLSEYILNHKNLSQFKQFF